MQYIHHADSSPCGSVPKKTITHQKDKCIPVLFRTENAVKYLILQTGQKKKSDKTSVVFSQTPTKIKLCSNCDLNQLQNPLLPIILSSRSSAVTQPQCWRKTMQKTTAETKTIKRASKSKSPPRCNDDGGIKRQGFVKH